MGVLVVLSLATGAVLRDRLPASDVDAVHRALAYPNQWFADRVAAMRGVPTGHPLPAPPAPPIALPIVTAMAPTTSPPNAPNHPAAASPGPPEVSVSSLPVATATSGPTAASAPVRAPVFVAPPPRVRPAPRAERAAAAAVQDTTRAKAPALQGPPKIAPPAVANASPPPVPGSLDDLIRKEVEKDKKKR